MRPEHQDLCQSLRSVLSSLVLPVNYDQQIPDPVLGLCVRDLLPRGTRRGIRHRQGEEGEGPTGRIYPVISRFRSHGDGGSVFVSVL